MRLSERQMRGFITDMRSVTLMPQWSHYSARERETCHKASKQAAAFAFSRHIDVRESRMAPIRDKSLHAHGMSVWGIVSVVRKADEVHR